MEHPANAVIDLLDMGTIHISFRSLKKLGPGKPRVMHMRVGNKTEERLLFIFSYKLDRFISNHLRQKCLIIVIRDMGNGFLLKHDGKWLVRTAIGNRIPPFFPRPHIIGVRDSKIGIKTLGKRHKFWLVSEMPFSKASGCISIFLKHFSYGDFTWV